MPLFSAPLFSPPSECTGRPSGRLLSSPLFSPLLPRRARLPRRAALTHNHRSPDHPSPPAPPKPSPRIPPALTKSEGRSACPERTSRRAPSADERSQPKPRCQPHAKPPSPLSLYWPTFRSALLRLRPPSSHRHSIPAKPRHPEPAPFAGEGPQPKPIQKPHAKPIFLPPSPPKKIRRTLLREHARFYSRFVLAIPRTSASIDICKMRAVEMVFVDCPKLVSLMLKSSRSVAVQRRCEHWMVCKVESIRPERSA